MERVDNLPGSTVSDAPSHGQLGRSEGTDVIARYKGYVGKKWLVIVVTLLILFVSGLLSVGMGSATLTISESIGALLGGGDDKAQNIVMRLRFPRVLVAIVGGFGLAIAGAAFQSVLRNPLASPSTLGVAQGASFGASIGIIVFGAGTTAGVSAASPVQINNPYIVTICAFSGAMLSTVVILGLSRFRQITPESMVLAGVALSAIFSAGTTLVQYFADEVQIAAVVFWTFGDLGRASYNEIAIIVLIVLIVGIYFMYNRWNYNAMESGETTAIGLGVNANRVRLWTMIMGTLVTSVVVSFVGIISFIGLIAPHIMRRFIGSDHRYLIPAAGVAGGLLLLLSDLAARMIMAPIILPIGAITSFLGGPMFLYLLFKGVNRR
ncbi:Hemin transport system permease protein HmuU [Corynebacterium cystitidis DSM 20524]|uniref:Iron complex transport system permease protein n=1 Tax=Corynebacterium cystitidis DSM 20524 TaxID=1121357 RepID=A0A1H9NV36_9CORY|nr:Hemin transport system permease protein HmuU [Corynebacterium cystitidis DSM 20524]SER39741.1 iron complex transport system permease protein [Corynebacterium cystitidis DSM 20524]SNV71371.1 iron ABC transporter permease [Corynebacterium cystitidis]